MKPKEKNMSERMAEEEMTVDIEIDDGKVVTCAIVTILPVAKQDYIVLLPLEKQEDMDEGDVWI